MNKENLTKELNVYLANLNILYVKLHNYHWNVNGTGFFELHAQFENFYNQVSLDLDAVAERLLTIGERPAASMKEYLEIATIEEKSSEAISSKESVELVIKDFKLMLDSSNNILKIAEELKDVPTADMLTQFIANYEKTLWMLEAYSA
ncbi:DNA starvation/stationary phase protection protein [Clostridium sp. MSJ-4]|uniref:DNA starvation/stationary phase protection protein n=1 Tax=Clostridium simiarum TaxID=2841506 RepID=A0ABS6EZ36_9CLOT|nr:DNA starvation/stationary phase protection protein [Clostridium simiarum]MBU5591481.1 DNA starvation/stationary phase protection protein [Clostridium simiarum]